MAMNIRNDFYASAAADVLSTRKFTAKFQTQDIIGIVVFLAFLPIGFLYAVTFPLSFWFELLSKWLLRVVPCSLLGMNVYLNAMMMVKVGPNSFTNVLPSVVKADFHFCHSCQLNSPPRSFHCPVCDFCVCRRDHHCSFTASCVGHFNQRYFVAAVLNLWPIAFCCCVWNWGVLLLAFAPLSPFDLLKWVFPHVALLLRFISLYQFLVVLAFAFSLVTLLFTTYLIVAQLFCFWRGQTRVEFLMVFPLVICLRMATPTNCHFEKISPWVSESDGLSSSSPLSFLRHKNQTGHSSERVKERQSLNLRSTFEIC